MCDLTGNLKGAIVSMSGEGGELDLVWEIDGPYAMSVNGNGVKHGEEDEMEVDDDE